jgi:hypothetical protein
MNRRKLTRVLLESGCDPNVRNKQGEAAADIARRKHLADIVDILHRGQREREARRDLTTTAVGGKSVDDSADDVDAIRLAPDCDDDEEEEDEGPKTFARRRDHSSNSSKENWDSRQQSGSRRKSKPKLSSGQRRQPGFADTARVHYYRDGDPVGDGEESLMAGEQYFMDLAGNIRKVLVKEARLVQTTNLRGDLSCFFFDSAGSSAEVFAASQRSPLSQRSEATSSEQGQRL